MNRRDRDLVRETGCPSGAQGLDVAHYAELLDDARGGDDTTLQRLLVDCDREVREGIAGQIPARFQSAFDVTDVLQVTFLEAFLRITQFRGSSRSVFVGWLSNMARNNLRDACRELSRQKRPDRKRQVNPRADDSYTTLLGNLAASVSTPSGHAARAEIATVIDEALKILPPDYARVIRLYDLDGKPIREVMTAMKRSKGAIHMLRARALDRLHELLGDATNFFSHGA